MFQTVMDQVWNALFGQGNAFLQGGLILGALASVGYWLKSLPAKLWSLFLFHCTVIVDVLSTDEAYQWLLLWLDQQAYTKKARRVSLRNVTAKNGDMKSLLVPAKGHHWFMYKGLPVWLQRRKDDEGAAPSGQQSLSDALAPKERLSIRTIGRKRERLSLIIDEAKHLYEAVTTDKLRVKTRRWGEWASTVRRKRPLDSVFMPPQGKHLLKDMRRFMQTEEWYRKMCIPYRRRYLLMGPPGTGKTSTAEALASELDIPVYIINLANMSDSGLEEAIAQISCESAFMLLLEDVDTVISKRAEAAPEDDTPQPATTVNSKLSLGTLLNVLDGMQAADNILLVMTTNHPDRLDTALKRKGRADVHVEFCYATEEQISAALNKFLPNATPEQKARVRAMQRPFPMCDLQEVLKKMCLEEQDLKPDLLQTMNQVVDNDLWSEIKYRSA